MIIEFKGELSDCARKFLVKNQIKGQVIAALIVFSLFSPLAIGLIIQNYVIIGIMFLMSVALFVGLSFVPPSRKTQNKFFPTGIIIDVEDSIITRVSSNGEMFRGFDNIEVIKDYGEWYHIVFNWHSKDPYFVCQKNLLTQGSIEDFEKLFEDQIERKS